MEATRRRPNARGQGELLRAEIVEAAMRMLDELADDEALSLRAVAREVSIAATSVYLHFPDRDALVLAAMERCAEGILRRGDEAEAAHEAPAAQLRARLLAMSTWSQAHPGLYKVMHESKVNRRYKMPFKAVLGARIQTAVQRCMDAGIAPQGDAATVALDLRMAVLGMLTMRLTEPDMPWPPVTEQVDRFMVKLVGIA
jgi:AcrR family transcriptional regulator